MKKIIASCLLLVVLLILNGCSTTEEKTSIDKTKNIDNTKNIVKITIRTQPGNDNNLRSTEDKKQISVVFNYINDLDLKKTTKDAGQYNGMSYIITVFFEDKKSTEYVLFGNMFFKESGKVWYEIPYKQAEKIEDIYNSLGSK
jgi:hypothetical protein